LHVLLARHDAVLDRNANGTAAMRLATACAIRDMPSSLPQLHGSIGKVWSRGPRWSREPARCPARILFQRSSSRGIQSPRAVSADDAGRGRLRRGSCAQRHLGRSWRATVSTSF